MSKATYSKFNLVYLFLVNWDKLVITSIPKWFNTLFQGCALTTPRGLDIKARGCAYSRYPGKEHEIKSQPQRGCISKPRVARIRATLGRMQDKITTPTGLHIILPSIIPRRVIGIVIRFMCNPVGVDIPSISLPRVARVRATPGFDVQPRWGWKHHFPYLIPCLFALALMLGGCKEKNNNTQYYSYE